jgi:hypothetical protein
MNKVISWLAYCWLLTIEASEYMFESVKRRLFKRSDSATEIRNPQLNDRFRILPPTTSP